MVYIIQRGDSLSKVAKQHQLSLMQILAANPRYKSNPNQISVGDRVTIPGSGSDNSDSTELVEELNPVDVNDDPFTVPCGQLTFDAEGLEQPGRYFSRTPHVPGAWSGVTIGRGYDLKLRSENEICTDLSRAGVAADMASQLAACCGLKGAKARDFIAAHGVEAITITPQQQKQLFIQTYQELEGDVIRICTKLDVEHKYGRTEWDTLDQAIRDTVVDLRYRGDYTAATRQRIQPIIVANDLAQLKLLMADRQYWVERMGVPVNRFNRRNRFLKSV
ncbi:MAG: LysM peptidoglycan-binding domain-containing protein [Halopseudomonas sp.]